MPSSLRVSEVLAVDQHQGSPVTALTPPRADMQLLMGCQLAPGNEVTLIPGAVRGKGSFGRVVEGVYQGQRVAVKLLPEAHAWGGASLSLLDSFAQEVEVLGRCDHPNVVRLLAACLTPPRQCLVLELMETSLERLLYGQPCGTVLPLRMVLHIATCIAKGLAYLHPTIVHRDLKPGNVLMNDPWGPNPVVKLADFGLARLRITTQPTETPDAGTPSYLAPEGFDPAHCGVITHQFDIYSLAVLMWEMLAGRQPWKGVSLVEVAYKVAQQHVRPPLWQIPEERCPPKLRTLIEQCWDPDPRRRPAAAEVAKCLLIVLQATRAGLDPQTAAEVGHATAKVQPESMFVSEELPRGWDYASYADDPYDDGALGAPARQPGDGKGGAGADDVAEVIQVLTCGAGMLAQKLGV
ncbi:hypothetical protein GPECTOR_3g325 [Gonium pectorale]|uniref:Protein kinase domain-containing protein n=1 Tax=Gonium pectorale TaxID=33097 RepID=A0A150GZ98_GONPE|nr:hypothetical protein GPECTOR_3g325 [Gonium pectorale]|eukprot:KXZ55179.1 hypothetical protein GPECTOR_3g325 [Gonium pectorale]